MKRLCKMLPALLACVLAGTLVLFPTRGIADFGDFSGSTDYDFDSGSSWDWDDDSSSSWDWDDDYSSSSWDWDDDYSSSSRSRSGSDSSLSLADVLLLAQLLVVGAPPLVIILVIMRLLRKVRQHTRRNGSNNAGRTGAPKAPKPATYRPAAPVEPARGKPVSSYTEVDPDFDVSAFKERMSNLYLQMQHAWTAKDISPVRPYFTAALYGQMESQIKQKIAQGQTNYVERIAVMSVDPKTWYQEGGYDHIVLRITARIVDYTLDDATGNLVSGSRTDEKFMTYEWDVSRKTGTTTTPEPEQQMIECPNCGATIDINASAKCPYCDSVITTRHEDWAISSIKGIKQGTSR